MSATKPRAHRSAGARSAGARSCRSRIAVVLAVCALMSLGALPQAVASPGEEGPEHRAAPAGNGMTAGGFRQPQAGRLVPARRDLRELMHAADTQPLDEITTTDLLSALELASVARQQEAHVQRSYQLSWVIPGAGHYLNGTAGTAIGFAATDLAIGAVTLLLGTWLLPPAVQPANLDYLQSPLSVIEERWMSVTPAELIPSVAVLLTGGALSAYVRAFAANDAALTAHEALEAGTIVFSPRPEFLVPEW